MESLITCDMPSSSKTIIRVLRTAIEEELKSMKGEKTRERDSELPSYQREERKRRSLIGSGTSIRQTSKDDLLTLSDLLDAASIKKQVFNTDKTANQMMLIQRIPVNLAVSRNNNVLELE